MVSQGRAGTGHTTGQGKVGETRVNLQGKAGEQFHSASPQEHLCPGRLEPRTDPSLGAGRGAQRGAHSAVTVLWMAVGSFVPGSL